MASSEATGQETEYVFDFSGGRLCLDFTNTVSGSRAHPTERLNDYQDLVSWGRQAGVLGDREAQRLAQAARQDPDAAARALAKTVEFREALFRILAAAVSIRPPDPDDLAVLNAMLPRALSHQRIERQAGGFAWGWTEDAEALDRMLWPVARSAADLLVSPELKRVRQCAGANCDWLFVDMSRNGSRRWCDMSECGNRAKARRYYERHRAKAGGVERAKARSPR
jgi:predicted RNA-binding Zn ribbon-like protein